MPGFSSAVLQADVRLSLASSGALHGGNKADAARRRAALLFRFTMPHKRLSVKPDLKKLRENVLVDAFYKSAFRSRFNSVEAIEGTPSFARASASSRSITSRAAFRSASRRCRTVSKFPVFVITDDVDCTAAIDVSHCIANPAIRSSDKGSTAFRRKRRKDFGSAFP
jgi:hypothetical protein